MSEDPSHLSQEAMNIFLILEQRMLIASQSNLIYGGCEDANTTIKYQPINFEPTVGKLLSY